MKELKNLFIIKMMNRNTKLETLVNAKCTAHSSWH